MKEDSVKTLLLSDGRLLAYEEYGDLQGYPVLLFHGTPGSRIYSIEDDPKATELGIRLIAFDRPGFGASDPKPDRTLLDWAKDINEAAQMLGLKEFSVLGVSGGGPYAAACGYVAPQGLKSVALVASSMPFQNGKAPSSMVLVNRLAFFLSRKAPWLLRYIINTQIKMMDKNPEGFKKSLSKGNKHLPEWDRALLEKAEDVEVTFRHMREAYRQGSEETIRECVLLSQSWNFSLKSLKVPTYVFHGEADNMAPFEVVQKEMANAPNCQFFSYKKAGHFISDDEEIWQEVLLTLRDGKK
ncbi:MAG: alpha/beta hydrolase [Desulfitobacterium sp.]|nr:alpha/beta hydrolase [Desulfitobacterium sp.]